MYHGRFKGTHYEAGYRYGQRLFNHHLKIDHCPTFPINDQRMVFAKKCLPLYKKYYPEVIEEIKGFVDGNQTSFTFLSTMLLTMYCYNENTRCSCFAFCDQGHIVFGRNSDFLVSLEKLYMNALYNLDHVYAFNGNTTAFIEIEDGVNEHGLAVGLTFVASKYIKPGLNAGMLVRYILEKCGTLEECLTFLKKVPIASAQTLTIIDRTGKMAVAECNCDEVKIITNPNYVYSTNTFISSNMQKYNLPHFDNWRALERYQTFEKAFLTNKNYDVPFSINLLSGQYGFICGYNRQDNADTVWSVIYDLKNKKIYRVEGNPSRKKFKEDVRFQIL